MATTNDGFHLPDLTKSDVDPKSTGSVYIQPNFTTVRCRLSWEDFARVAEYVGELRKINRKFLDDDTNQALRIFFAIYQEFEAVKPSEPF